MAVHRRPSFPNKKIGMRAILEYMTRIQSENAATILGETKLGTNRIKKGNGREHTAILPYGKCGSG